jgi:hypothetical protein
MIARKNKTIKKKSSTIAIFVVFSDLPYGLVVRITGFHPVGPGSIPGMGIVFCLFLSSEAKIVFHNIIFHGVSVIVNIVI